jgi:hypothetical protein
VESEAALFRALSDRGPMRIWVTSVFVDDQPEALEF